ncbi:MAG: DUF1947 domain-containing protein [Asgard group archaeon]|nr:DUF1947 domain-containing protein [Asgard group archaeon]
MEIIRRHVMRKSDFKEIKEQLQKIIKDEAETLFEKNAEIIVTDEGELYAENKIILAFKYEDMVLPTLRALNNNKAHLPTVTVDMGAVKFVTNGADIMAPGITKITSDLPAKSIVAIVDENFGKSLAIGELLFDSNEIAKTSKGKVIKNIHYVNDQLWTLTL